ncbi:hypothetical protein C5U62_32865 [Pseudomonas protegens]|uniref:DUF637 domain-containing protein n=1 Tax=Pseudomonas protegens TaxID=380021 RepID=A0A2T6GAU7_9PSED|nr:DUF637 domain-containing protein [Pseudomonas protegens]PUA41276.1 hypothetical protein C5U62_32865 [Pseudomonas protegens]
MIEHQAGSLTLDLKSCPGLVDHYNLGLAVKETFSAGSLKNAAVAGVTAGLIDYADTKWFSDASGAANGGSTVASSGPLQNPGYASSMFKPENWANTLLRSGTHALINGSVSTVITGGSLGSNLGDAFIGEGIELGAAIGNKKIGDLAANLDVAPKIAEKLVLHAALGGLIAKARGESFASGAIAGGVAQGLTPIANGLLAEYVSSRFEAADLSAAGSQLKIGTTQIIGLIAAGAAGGNPATGSLIGGTAEKYNDQGVHLDPTDQFNDDGLPPQNTLSDVDSLKAKISLFILIGLAPEFLGGAAEGVIARITGMFSKSPSEALAGAGTRAGAGGASEIGANVGGAVAEDVGAAAEEIVAGAKASVDAPKGGFGPTYRPADSNQFEKILTSYYGAIKTGSRVGNGGLADAVRYEKATGEMLSPAGHEQKAIEVSNRLSELVRNANNQPPGKYPYSQRDIDFAKQLIKDLDNALGR